VSIFALTRYVATSQNDHSGTVIGFENDVVGSNGITINPSDLKIVGLGEKNNHPSDQSWLDFPGRWGYTGNPQEVSLGRAGPQGPVFKPERYAME
jgi:hypothetical protein